MARQPSTPLPRALRPLAVAACVGLAACNPAPPSAQQHDIEATILDVASGPYHAGQTVTYHAKLVNHGPGRSGGVRISPGLADGSCVATAGASCPTAADLQLVPDLPANGSLTLTMTTQLAADGLGPQVIEFGVLGDAMDSNPANDIATSAALALVDDRSGTYHLYAADARAYDLQVDFANALWIMDGNGPERAGTITSTTDGIGIVYQLGPAGSFRPTTDGLVGAFDFGEGSMPFVAARTFATSAASVGTLAFAVPGRHWFGTYTSTFETATLSADSLVVCSALVPTTVAACPPGSLVTYALTANGSDFTGVDALDPNHVVHLRFANFGGQWALLQADEDASTARQFRVGLADVAPPTDTYEGRTTDGDTDTLVLSDTGWAMTRLHPDGTTVQDTASYAELGTGVPPGLRVATQASDAATFYLVAPGPIGMVVSGGASTSAGFVMTMLR